MQERVINLISMPPHLRNPDEIRSVISWLRKESGVLNSADYGKLSNSVHSNLLTSSIISIRILFITDIGQTTLCSLIAPSLFELLNYVHCLTGAVLTRNARVLDSIPVGIIEIQIRFLEIFDDLGMIYSPSDKALN